MVRRQAPKARRRPCETRTASARSHGIALRPTKTAGLYKLYTVTHAPFESIQVYALDARAGEPVLSWTGCVKIPSDLHANGVTAASDS